MFKISDFRLVSGFPRKLRVAVYLFVAALVASLFRAFLPLLFLCELGGQPKEVFKTVLGASLPDGVSDIQTAGRTYFIKRWGWMRIEGTPSALESLEVLAKTHAARDDNELTGTQMQHEMKKFGSANSIYDEADQRKVGWDSLKSIPQPVYYDCFFAGNNSWTWHCFFVFDKPRHRVYIQFLGD